MCGLYIVLNFGHTYSIQGQPSIDQKVHKSKWGKLKEFNSFEKSHNIPFQD